MNPETFTPEEKRAIARHIKDIDLDMVDKEMRQLMALGENAHTLSERSQVGNNVVDYFTFVQRLETKGKYNVNYFEFLANLSTFQQKKYIQTMLAYYETVKNKNQTKHPYKVYKEVYNICISAINIMRPLNCMEIYTRFRAKKVLNFCAGWGGSTVAAAALGLEAWHGIEINTDLREPYQALIAYLTTKSPQTQMSIEFGDASQVDYSSLDYDTVFASPPYYFLEKYPHNVAYSSKSEMDERFYRPLFANSFAHLKQGGHFVINVCREVYDNVLKPLLGEADELFPLKKSKRQNQHTEMVYVWRKVVS